MWLPTHVYSLIQPITGIAVITLALGFYLFAFIFKPSLGRGAVHDVLRRAPGDD